MCCSNCRANLQIPIKIIAITTFIVGLLSNAFSQTLNFKSKKVLLRDSLLVDTVSLIPGSVKIFNLSNNEITSEFEIDVINSILKSKNKKYSADSAIIYYRPYQQNLLAPRFRKDVNKIEFEDNRYNNPYKIAFKQNEEEYFKTEGLNKNGSISRGIIFGNNQDVVVNSSLNLQLGGKLTENVEVTAAISDNNIPIQPEGNTQQLQEFDRVYIQVNNQNNKLIVGDYQLIKPNSYFLNYNKRLQGGMLQNDQKFSVFKNNIENHSQMAVGISRGKFARNVILGIERNQGPYRLRGAENELFIIVLANTERIYIDGELLKRGQENDYIINYNTAEIIFTAKRIITKDKRIVAEFQYSDRNYARSMLALNEELKLGKQQINISFFSEQDNKNKPLLLNLSDENKRILSNAGDSLFLALVPAIDTVEFNTADILYLNKDSIIDGIEYKNIFEFSRNPELAKYKLTFSQVPQGSGNYIQINSAANGKVFQWIKPQNGIPQGNYEPVILLPTPKQRQMFALGYAYQISKKTNASIELVSSKNDVNTFSEIDKGNDLGAGLRLKVTDERPLKDTTINIFSSADIEMLDKNFVYIERYRPIEFERDWNRDFNTDIIRNQQIFSNVSAGLKKKSNFIKYTLSSFNEQNFYRGIMHKADFNFNDEKWTSNGYISSLNASDIQSENSFFRYRLLLQRKIIKKIKGGLSIENEESNFKKKDSEELLNNSFHFREYQAMLSNEDSSKINYTLKYIRRFDWAPKGNAQELATDATAYTFDLGITGKKGNKLKITTAYRKLNIIDSLISPVKLPDNTLLGRIEYNLKLWKGFITSVSFFETGSGLEVRREFNYLEVAQGTGIYQWKDYNENGIKELNEFEVAIFKDQANFIRVFNPTNSFVRTFNNQFNQVVNINPYSILSNKNNVLSKFISRFNNQFAFRSEKKITNDPGFISILNPFNNFGKDTSVATLNNSLRNTFSFNRLDPVYGIDYYIQKNVSGSLLLNGFESRSNDFSGVRFRVNGLKFFTFTAEYQQGLKQLESEFFNTRNYQINYREVKPELAFQPDVVWRISVNYALREKKNILEESEGEYLLNQTIGSEIRYNSPSKGTFASKFQMINLNFFGNANTPVGFEMLEALQPGINYTWNVLWQRSLSNNLQLNLSYDGRKSEGSRVIHTGGMQLRAFF